MEVIFRGSDKDYEFGYDRTQQAGLERGETTAQIYSYFIYCLHKLILNHIIGGSK